MTLFINLVRWLHNDWNITKTVHFNYVTEQLGYQLFVILYFVTKFSKIKI